jgi:hypothetical protein
MSRLAFEIIYYIAYCVFLMGASRSFRDNGSKSSVAIMTLGVLMDVSISLLPMTGIPFFQSGMGGTNAVLNFAIVFGIITVWLLYPLTLIFWKIGRLGTFHFLIVVIEICWFIDVVVFIYGMYNFPLE